MSRRAEIADAAITTLARDGMRGLTHRAVDRTAGLPEGSASYYFRTRQALLKATVDRLAELDSTDMAASSGRFEDLGPTVTAEGSRRSKIIDGPRLVPGLGSYSGCQVTRSNSLPSGSANVVWRTAATPGGSAAGGSLISWSGLAPRPVSRSVSSSWRSVTRTGWTLFLAVPGSAGL